MRDAVTSMVHRVTQRDEERGRTIGPERGERNRKVSQVYYYQSFGVELQAYRVPTLVGLFMSSRRESPTKVGTLNTRSPGILVTRRTLGDPNCAGLSAADRASLSIRCCATPVARQPDRESFAVDEARRRCRARPGWQLCENQQSMCRKKSRACAGQRIRPTL